MFILAEAQQLASSVASTAQKIQHYRVTLEAAKRQYKAGLLTATGLIYYAIAIQRSPGWKIKLDAQTVERELGIKKTAFYSAISKLKEEGFIDWEARRGINAWIPVFGCDDLSHDEDYQQEEFSANAEEVPDRGNKSVIAEPETLETIQGKDCATLTNTQYIFNTQQTDNTAVVEEKEKVEEESPPQPTHEKEREILTKVQQLGVKLNWTVRNTIQRYFANVIEAIAHIKERLQSGESFRCLEAAFVKACKEGALPERLSCQEPKQHPLPSPEQKALLQQAKWERLIADYYLAPFDGGETIMVDDWINRRVLTWWQYLNDTAAVPNCSDLQT
jgi:hypothetical protein